MKTTHTEKVTSAFRSVGALFFNPRNEPSPAGRIVSHLIIIVLFLSGILHWALFLNFGNITFQGDDWPKDGKYYSILKHWVSTGEVPYHTKESLQATNRFFAIPETVLSPQVILLKYVDVGTFVLINTLIFYTLGFIGCLLIRSRYKLSILPFAALILLFNFNGFITSHLGVGHSMWNGYFLLPFFCLFVFDLASDQSKRSFWSTTALKLALTMFFIVLQGSFHLYVWCFIFLALLAIFNRRCLIPAAGSIFFSLWLSIFRFLPAMITFGRRDESFMTGYPTLMDFLYGFVTIRYCNYGHIPALVQTVPWWEFDLFIGLAAFLAILYFGIFIRWRNPQAISHLEFASLDWPMATMTILSFSAFYFLIAMLPLPLLNAERVSSRFLVIPTIFLIILSTIRIDQLLPQLTKTTVRKLVFLVVLAETAFELATHSSAWRVEKIEQLCNWHSPDLSFTLVTQADSIYKMSLYISLIISAIGFLVLCVLLIRQKAGRNPAV